MRFPLLRFSLLAFLFASTLSGLFAQTASTNAREKQWSVESVPWAQLGRESVKIDLHISHQAVVANPGKLAGTKIPVEAIVNVTYDETAQRKGGGLWDASNPLNDKDLDFILAPLGVGAGLAALFKTREHFIYILWRKDGEPQEFLFQAGKGDYKNILAELQTVTGKPWRDLPSERQKLREELDRAKDRKIALQIERTVLVNGTELKPGPCQLVLLERTESQGEAYFFSGSQVHLDRVAAQAVVRVEHPAITPDAQPKSSGGVQPEMVFGNQASENTLTDLHLPDKTLHFTAPAVPGIAGSGARIFSSGGNRWGIVRRTTHNGEPALSFRVLYSAVRPCTEILYVTQTQVAIEPASPSDSHCTTLSAPRNEVKAQTPTGIGAGSSLEFTWNEKPYQFQPLFESASSGDELPGIGRESRAAAHKFGEFFNRALEDFDAVERETQTPAAPMTNP